MKALRFTNPNRPELAELPIPEIADDEVLVAARSVGVCHSDIDPLEGRYIIPIRYPIIPGHEWAGEVARVGARVADFAPGDRVVGECVIGQDHFGFSIDDGHADKDFAALLLLQAKAAGIELEPERVAVTDGL